MGTKYGHIIEVTRLKSEKEALEKALKKIIGFEKSKTKRLGVRASFLTEREGFFSFLFKRDEEFHNFVLSMDDIDDNSQELLDAFILSLKDDYQRRIDEKVNRLEELGIQF